VGQGVHIEGLLGFVGVAGEEQAESWPVGEETGEGGVDGVGLGVEVLMDEFGADILAAVAEVLVRKVVPVLLLKEGMQLSEAIATLPGLVFI
jgi:hypothetical protein